MMGADQSAPIPIFMMARSLRLAVEALSGGLPFTIYAGSFERVRVGSDNFSRELTNDRKRNWRRGESAFGKGWRGAGLAGQAGRGRNGEKWDARNVGQLRTSGAAMPSTNCWKDVGGKEFGSSGRTRTYNPSVNSRMLYH